jgi:hypothetical protein
VSHLAEKCPHLIKFGFADFNFRMHSQAFTTMGSRLVSLSLDALTLHDSNECYNLVKCLSTFKKLQEVTLEFKSGPPDLDSETSCKLKSEVYNKMILSKLKIKMEGRAENLSIWKTLCYILSFIQLAQNADVHFKHVILSNYKHC